MTLAGVFQNPGFYMTYAVVQAVVVLVVIQLLDGYKRRPILLIGLLALWGASGAAAIALTINRSVRRWVPGSAGVVFGDAIGPPVVEECAKGFALLVLKQRPVPGKKLKNGAKVNLIVGKGPRKR
jgi:RsiW-degrading membrane proteinase PrsW (M82 family)